ncbi:MAG: DUF5682 family protein [Caldilineaceae bacterium]
MHQVFGIRHHGPGSARSLVEALRRLEPDIVLVEGPPDANSLLSFLAHAQMKPPVALLIYAEEDARRAAFYPFAEFSPEFQAIRFALGNALPVRFIDLPQAHQLVEVEETAIPIPAAPVDTETVQTPSLSELPDPFAWIAQASGYEDGERWWEAWVEQRRQQSDLFEAIHTIMHELRQEDATHTYLGSKRNQLREAYMRQSIRQAQREGFEKIAVVCGAWHAPALSDLTVATSEQADATLLKGLPKCKVAATWTPWTYSRLTYASGYGAGIASPGWYEHLWRASGHDYSSRQTVVHWMTRVAHLLRQKELDASSASVIESVRLAETLAAFRGRVLPDLSDLNEAARTLFCFGDDLPMRLIHEQLIVGEQIGAVPDDVPSTPFQRDLVAEQRRLRLPTEALTKSLELDLRKPTDLERSRLLHRLALLGIAWGKLQKSSGKGTFREVWQLSWQPEFAVRIVEASIWGSSVVDAATGYASALARGVDAKGAVTMPPTLSTLSGLLDSALLADLPTAVPVIMCELQAQAALAADVAQLMEALPALANIVRYGNVRQTDSGAVSQVVDGFVVRICIGLPVACAALNDEAANQMLPRLVGTHAAIELLQVEAWSASWLEVLRKIVDLVGLHGLLAGRLCRLLLDRGLLDSEVCAQRMWLALSTANEPAQAAAWIEGLLGESGLLLVHDERLWQVVDRWVSTINSEHFTQVLPLLRRSFARFSHAERRQMGELVKVGRSTPLLPTDADDTRFDSKRAEQVLPLVAKMLGIEFVNRD